MMSRIDEGGRRGAALAVAVLLLLAVLALAQGALSLASLELQASLADRRLLRADAGAEVGIRTALSSVTSAGLGGVPLWGRVPIGSGALDGETFTTHLDRLSREVWLLESVGRERGGPGVVRLGRAVWILDPIARVADTNGVLEIEADAPVTLGGEVDGTEMTAEAPPLLAGTCAAWKPALDSIFPVGRLAAIHRYAADTLVAEPSMGLLDAAWLLSLVPARVAGEGRPIPADGSGSCDERQPWNWGAPLRPGSPCGSYLVTVAAEEDLTVRGGQGQGVLVVRGDLLMTDTARFHGLVLVGGTLRLQNGAEVTGLVRVGRGVETAAGTRIRGSACWVVRALDAAAGILERPVPLGGPEWIGPLGPDP